MQVVRVRKVGNSTVVTLPKQIAADFPEGTELLVTLMPDGNILLIRATQERANIIADYEMR